jgi:hypothetical protein
MMTGTAPLAHRVHDESKASAGRLRPSRRKTRRPADGRGSMTAVPRQADPVEAQEGAARSEAR